ncbi:hypothetical protein [Roseivirga pacifica]|uniref:hypothetical protein n=1 Tax=Roseivirga pacifica TaxID=1267423 RepID=UPI00209476BA|nr:hypothetical protein [Roseivirga pacifica]MCO6358769.1 hypothetical protein [Roseivirga pacifica]MCO6365595.1 hypothetical protein [Roseivirga pacifica]MCO6371675.1 hypothetical protein [Roseivirga pacifica]MCO6376214.1 hypothetical protein [Roseivirga pacifica]MCO6379053.1 hypothetical protein [Roseivirga pacifica]
MIEEILKSYKKIHPIQINMEGAGFGAIILVTINQLRYCERENLYPIVCYTTECKNAFLDPTMCGELWEQYFEPVMPLSYGKFREISNQIDLTKHLVKLSSAEAIKVSEEDPDSVYSFPFGKWRSQDLGDLDLWYAKERKKGRETIGKYIKPKIHILQKVDSFYEQHFSNRFVLGVHIRGTDLHYAPVVSPAEYFPHIDSQIEKEPTLKIFLATDQAQYIPVFEKRYGNRIVYSDSFRSDNEIAPFQRKELSPYKKGEDVLLDILLLSKADFLIKGSSNVGEMAMYFNPSLECLDLGYKKQKAFGQSYDKDWDNHTNPPAWQLISKRGLDRIAKDTDSQSLRQLIWYKARRKAKSLRIYLGKIKQRILSS